MFDKGIEVSNDNEEMLLDKMLASKAKKQTCLQNSTRETILLLYNVCEPDWQVENFPVRVGR